VKNAIGVRGNDNSTPGHHDTVFQYGRRIEADRIWTVYHVFTGVPADDAEGATIGLDWTKATSLMASLNISRPAEGTMVSVLPPHSRSFSLWDFRQWL
jgi:hypothetical protein